MSHNSKYYAKKILLKDSKDLVKVTSFFKPNTGNSRSESQAAASKDLQPETKVHSSKTESETTATVTRTSSTTPNYSQTESQAASDDLQHELAKSETTATTVTRKRKFEIECPSSDIDNGEPDLKPPVTDQRLTTVNQGKYEVIYPWLYWSVVKNGYLCKTCEIFPLSQGTKQDFVDVGMVMGDHPIRKLNKHDSSNRHRVACEKLAKAKSSMVSSASPSVYTQILSMKTASDDKTGQRNRDILKKLFRITYFITRKHWAQSNFSDVVKFIASLGVEDLQYHIDNAPPVAHYMSTYTVTEFINIIGDVMERDMLESLRAAKFFALLADESTDEQTREQLSIFAKWVNDEEKPVDHFLGIIQVERTDSETLANKIQQFLLAKNVNITRCRFVGFDGTNAMSGEISGLQRRMRHLSPMCLYMNCRNHRLALCLRHLMKAYKLLVQVDEMLLAIWKLFHYSPRRFEVLKGVQELYGEEALSPIRAATTRWLSHGKACIRFINRFQAITDTLDILYQERREPEVYGLRNCIMQKDFIAMVLLLCDVLQPVNRLSLFLQDADLNFVNVDIKVKATANELEALIPLLENQDATTYFSKIDELFTEIDDRTNLARRQRINAAQLTSQQFLQLTGCPFIHSLINEIQDAFQCHPVFKSFKALDPRQLPDTIIEIGDFGTADIKRLGDHYGTAKEDTFKGHVSRCNADLDQNGLVTEYTGFKHQMFISSLFFTTADWRCDRAQFSPEYYETIQHPPDLFSQDQ
ncbi:uncharacterized protein LOC117319689 isoform X2 [Pecten maximus]|uniref:uncharacterized protein LOC117319689 isoform X2 n=1 Tax=Pecten maximus TaxID=6579 RepID=UPI00145893CE|nr:uncharacterized protein LOC117319689 isoform X2 [Pecten maximus]